MNMQAGHTWSISVPSMKVNEPAQEPPLDPSTFMLLCPANKCCMIASIASKHLRAMAINRGNYLTGHGDTHSCRWRSRSALTTPKK